MGLDRPSGNPMHASPPHFQRSAPLRARVGTPPLQLSSSGSASQAARQGSLPRRPTLSESEATPPSPAPSHPSVPSDRISGGRRRSLLFGDSHRSSDPTTDRLRCY